MLLNTLKSNPDHANLKAAIGSMLRNEAKDRKFDTCNRLISELRSNPEVLLPMDNHLYSSAFRGIAESGVRSAITRATELSESMRSWDMIEPDSESVESLLACAVTSRNGLAAAKICSDAQTRGVQLTLTSKAAALEAFTFHLPECGEQAWSLFLSLKPGEAVHANILVSLFKIGRRCRWRFSRFRQISTTPLSSDAAAMAIRWLAKCSCLTNEEAVMHAWAQGADSAAGRAALVSLYCSRGYPDHALALANEFSGERNLLNPLILWADREGDDDLIFHLWDLFALEPPDFFVEIFLGAAVRRRSAKKTVAALSLAWKRKLAFSADSLMAVREEISRSEGSERVTRNVRQLLDLSIS